MTTEPATGLRSRPRPERERLRREAALDETIEQSFPASDPPSTDPNPDSDTEKYPEARDLRGRPTCGLVDVDPYI